MDKRDLLPTIRGIDEYAFSFGMDRKKFLNWLQNKQHVLDLGAGGGSLEKEIEILKVNSHISTKIVALDLLYKNKKGVDFSNYATHLSFHNSSIVPSLQELNKVNSKFEQNSISAIFQNLPFADNVFDGILASYSFVQLEDKGELAKSYNEVLRVLKPGGEAFITLAGVNLWLPENIKDKTNGIERNNEHYFTRITKPLNFQSLPKS